MFIISEWGYMDNYIPGKIEPPSIFANRLRELTADSPAENMLESRIGLEWSGSFWRLPLFPNSLSYFSYGMSFKYNIGTCLGIVDDLLAKQNFMISANMGCPEAMYMYAEYIENESRGLINRELAKQWYIRAANLGLRVACLKIANYLESNGDLENSEIWVNRAYRESLLFYE